MAEQISRIVPIQWIQTIKEDGTYEFTPDPNVYSTQKNVPSTSKIDLQSTVTPTAISASFAVSSSNAVSSSFATTSSFAQTSSYLNTLNQNLTFNGNLTLNGTASITYLNVSYESSSIIYSSGSNQFGDASNDTQTLYGSVIIPTGSVGIGTTSPGRNLDVVGTTETTIRIRDTGGSSLELYQQATDSYLLATNALHTYTSGSLRLSITSTGNVGIGTISPSAKLQVENSGSVAININDSSNSQIPTINFQQGGTTKAFIEGGVNLSSRMDLGVGNNRIITLASTGNVGIGTTTPSSKLDVSGSARITDGLTVTGSTISTGGFTGSLQGTATTASYVLNAVSSSFALTASFVQTAQTASYVETAQTSSYIDGGTF